MNILFEKKIEKHLSSHRVIQRKFGRMSDVIEKLLDSIHKLTDYRQLWNLPGKFHELKYQADNVYAVTLKHPYRLVMRLEEDHQSVHILDIVDYHDNCKIIANYN